MYNSDLIEETDVVNCRFSDHCFVLAKLQLVKPKSRRKTILSLNLSIQKLNEIFFHVEQIDWKDIKILNDLEYKWKFFKDKIMKIVDEISPLKNITIHYKPIPLV